MVDQFWDVAQPLHEHARLHGEMRGDEADMVVWEEVDQLEEA